jgi:hydroxymethylpyrimidine/phosphomethylpyrimidine kinase
MTHSRCNVPPCVLTFAATDPTGGAGIQADLLSYAGMGCHGLSVVTAVTVQDTAGVEAVFPMESDWLIDQARAVLEDMPVQAIKLGVLGSIENIAAIAEIVSDYPDIPLVMDPVLASGRGDEFSDEMMIEAMRDLLLPQVTVLTPNSVEARRLVLTGHDEADDDPENGLSSHHFSLGAAAAALIEYGVGHVLITGTHEHTAQVINTLYGEGGVLRTDAWERLPGSYHGSGCTLASALAAALAQGMDLIQAVGAAQHFTWHSLAQGFKPGMGQAIPNRMFQFWSQEQ